ncbi:FecR domain-containing protein [Aliifodinibius sp. S!AR15-10]|uniref:FecR family protein n=1 Tax=Aliifodinibius sp. S!AR15-10 TaxID=2950437 RepID=UPI002858406C|nr:FecR domain-containing protein [Aliifodinibius sp. S!AR15-10]MDR8392417.1 FecR domain-containing protein [Aliifodinibius sp. S!AR15-10]
MPRKQTLEDLLDNDSFVRWIKDNASEEENKYWQEWLSEDPTRKELVEQARELVVVAELGKPIFSQPEKELRRLEQSMDQIDAQSDKDVFRKMHQRSGAFFGAVAAGLIMIIAVIGFLVNQNYPSATSDDTAAVTESKHEFRTDYGEKISLNLSDGSEIVLNANSHLKYFTSIEQGQDIEVWLEGEAYFDIYHYEGNQQRSFTVHTADGSVEVLGTKFFVKTSSEGTQTVLEEGKVRISVDKGDTNSLEKNQVVMAPGELAHFNVGIEEVQLLEVNPEVYTSWTEGTWMFDQTPLSKVAKRIEDTFGVEVRIVGNLQQKILSGSITSTNLEFLQEALSKVINEPVTKKGDTLVIGG